MVLRLHSIVFAVVVEIGSDSRPFVAAAAVEAIVERWQLLRL